MKRKPIKKFKLGKILGEGAFGKVYEGFDEEHGFVMAVKQVYAPENASGVSRKKIDALQTEIELLKGLRHKNIVEYLGTCQRNENLHIFLEYVSGGSLESLY